MTYAFSGPAAEADKASQEAVSAGEAYEKYAAAVNEEAAAVVEVRDKVFKIADELGIGAEIRTLYHTTAMAARGGAAVGTAIEVIVTGSTLGAGAAAGMAAGMLVGVAVAVFSILTDDGSEQRAAERAARNKERDAALALALKRLDMAGLIVEQKNIAAAARRRAVVARDFNKFLVGTVLSGKFSLGDPAKLELAAQAADKIALLYQHVQKELKPAERELFVASANTSRWARYFMTFESEKQQLAADLKKGGLPGVTDKSITFYKEAQAKLNQLITAEHAHIKELTRPKLMLNKSILGLFKPKTTVKSSTLTAAPEGLAAHPAGAMLLTAAVVGGGLYAWHRYGKKKTAR